MNANLKPKLAWVLFLMAFVLTLPLTLNRLDLEQSADKVEIISEINESRLPVQVIKEYTLWEWKEKNWTSRWRPGLNKPFDDSMDDDELLIFSSEEKFKQALKVLNIKLEQEEITIRNFKDRNLFYILLSDTKWPDLKNTGMGFKHENYSLDTRYYFRPANDRYVNANYISWLFNNIEADGIIFRGETITGYPDNLDTLTESLTNKNLPVYIIEGVKQRGVKELISTGVKTARLHSIPRHIIDKDIFLSRIARALRERNIRGVYLNSREHNRFLPQIIRTIEDISLKPGKSVFYNILLSRKTFLRSVAGALSGGGLLLLFKTGTLATLTISLLIFFFSLIFGLNLAILILAIGFPVNSIQYALKNKTAFLPAIIYSFFIALAGGYFIGSIGFEPSYFLNVNPVRGIKLSLFLPLILAFMVAYKDNSEFLKKHATRLEIILAVFLVSVLSLYILRSSNLIPRLVSGAEINFRRFLEEKFVFRPRFKEFLWGHPLFIAGLFFLKQKRNFKISEINLGKLAVILGLIGQISIINSFMHFHTPITGSIIRSIWGFLLGICLSIVPIIIIKKWN